MTSWRVVKKRAKRRLSLWGRVKYWWGYRQAKREHVRTFQARPLEEIVKDLSIDGEPLKMVATTDAEPWKWIESPSSSPERLLTDGDEI